jgi:hypothetical protein
MSVRGFEWLYSGLERGSLRRFCHDDTGAAESSAFTLAKCVRDRQEEDSVTNRVERARVEKSLAEHDPFRVDSPWAGRTRRTRPFVRACWGLAGFSIAEFLRFGMIVGIPGVRWASDPSSSIRRRMSTPCVE